MAERTDKLLKILEPVMLLSVPAVLFLCACLELEFTAALTLLTVMFSLFPFFLRFEGQKPRPRDIMPIVVLAAIAAVGRIIFAPFPGFKPVTAIVMVSGICFGRQSGFLTGALAALGSNLFFGQGPWTPWQMYAWGLIGFGAGLLAERGAFRRPLFVYLYGFAAAMAYGVILDSWYVVGFIHPLTWQSMLAGYSAGLLFNLSHAVATVVFLLPIYQPWCKKIRRIQKKYGMAQL